MIIVLCPCIEATDFKFKSSSSSYSHSIFRPLPPPYADARTPPHLTSCGVVVCCFSRKERRWHPQGGSEAEHVKPKKVCEVCGSGPWLFLQGYAESYRGGGLPLP